jgi:hypothetical protein
MKISERPMCSPLTSPPLRPSIAEFGDHGQTELINDDIPTLAEAVQGLSGCKKQHWVRLPPPLSVTADQSAWKSSLFGLGCTSVIMMIKGRSLGLGARKVSGGGSGRE